MLTCNIAITSVKVLIRQFKDKNIKGRTLGQLIHALLSE
jgi:hypothetical protein